MRLLILGGTEFVGRAVTDDALARGWEVTVFHRGTHRPPEGVRELRGDRLAPGGLAALEAVDGRWDAVVDTWSAAPVAVRDAVQVLAKRADRYAYVSSGSVYTYPNPLGSDESWPLVDASPDAAVAPYPEAKRGAELAVLDGFGERALLARAGLILGPRENVGRLTWWLDRIARGGTVLAPGPRDLPLQYVDARDLAAFVLDGLAAGLGGAYNVIAPPGFTTMGELLETCRRVTGSDAQLRWTDPETILAAGIEGWTELPIWIEPGQDHATMHGTGVEKALAAGLRPRPVAETVADTWAWLQSVGGSVTKRPDSSAVGLDPAREATFLAKLDGDAASASVRTPKV
ncbi:NAD-dependent epimerase/dehydratase family protein [Streptacidiphilus fuscans]|uniref:NAD-dependent epimerase/dehydratase family protein n=1 Tax=Streptacidiphilus fuscans TaxID=2789292 RepID=A0A931BAR4_9ACTN|nr:NAD-dependent epimerase/dehydratase family protein [Streptacidiphilus fuscans]MBF9069990.1 NAD-dependent epimerase/dehydratase family protein [Streptacidiphilus fuscans]